MDGDVLCSSGDRSGGRPRSGRRWVRASWVVTGLILAWALAWSIEAWRFRSTLSRARSEVEGGLYRAAEPRLAALGARRPSHDEVNYLRGVCAQADGRPDAAVAAWRRLPPDSPFAVRADLLRGNLEVDRGRFADAEEALRRALRAPGVQVAEVRHALVQLFWHEGRVDEARRLIEANWRDLAGSEGPRSPEALRTLSAHIDLDFHTYPAEGVRAMLEAARSKAPGDDRVWLGLANLSVRSGDLREADRLLTLCQSRRPRDPAVWRARLAWAMATDHAGQVREAVAAVPAGDDGPAEALKIRAWFAARRGDRDAEAALLEALDESEPGNPTVLDRRAELASKRERADLVARLRRRKAEVHDARVAYQNALGAANPLRRAGELARLAGVLGRRFETECWSTLAGRPRPSRGKAVAAVPVPAAKTLADLLPEVVATGTTAAAPGDAATAGTSAAPPQFVDDAESAGLRFRFENGASARRQLPETMSGGVGLLDYDGDGRLDVYAVQGGPFPPEPGRPGGGDRLFRNLGGGRFEDVTAASGVAATPRGYGHGVAVGDYDNDGRPDLFVTRWRGYALLRNRGDGRFEDATEKAGLGGDRGWPTSAAFADLDNDGDLDLYVCHYLAWDDDNPRLCEYSEGPGHVYCNPRDFDPLPDHAFRNDGGRFVDVTDASGLRDPDGRGLGVVAADLDGDNRVEIYVANDMSANLLFRNLGGFRFRESAHADGAAAGTDGGYQAGMGVACGDLDGDGRPDLAVTNFYGESTTFFHNLGGGTFSDHTAAVGLAAPSRQLLGFGVAFLDADNDGRIDLLSVNGHINDRRPRFPWTMPAQLLLSGPGGTLRDVTREAGPPFQVLRLGRGLAVGDLDNDGRIDAVVLSQNEPLAYFHNQGPAAHSVTLGLVGTASNRDGVGAEVTVQAGGRRQTAQRFGGGSYQSAGDPRLHFGIGTSARVDQVEVRWPSGRVDRFHDLAADTGYSLREGEPKATPLRGWKPPGPGQPGGPTP